jgi:hypothetical protein
MIEMVVVRVNRCSKIQKPPKRHNDASEALLAEPSGNIYSWFPSEG